MLKDKRLIKLFAVFALFIMLLSQSQLTRAQQFEKTSNEDVISHLTDLMNNSIELDPAVESAWEDYMELLSSVELQDYTKEDVLESGSTYEELADIFSPEAEESMLEFSEYEKEYIYTYESDNLDQLSIHLYLYNDGLYATALISDQPNLENEASLSMEAVNEVIENGFPRIDVLKDAEPTVLGVINMMKDDQLGSIVAFPSYNGEDKMLEFVTYEGEINTSSVYFEPDTYEEIIDGTLMPISDQLVYYAIRDFIPSISLEELVTRNTTSNIGYRIAHEQLTILLESTVVRGLEDNVAGTTKDEVNEQFQPDAEMVELELADPLSAIAYSFEDPNNINDIGVLTIYFHEDQLAFASVENVRANWGEAQVTIDYSRGIEETALNPNDTITNLTYTEMDVPAIGIMYRDALPHQVAVIPVKDSENEVFFVDIYDYRIENYSNQTITDSTGELSDDLFNYIFDQY